MMPIASTANAVPPRFSSGAMPELTPASDGSALMSIVSIQEFLNRLYEQRGFLQLRAVPAIRYLYETGAGNPCCQFAGKRRRRCAIERADHHEGRISNALEQRCEIDF